MSDNNTLTVRALPIDVFAAAQPLAVAVELPRIQYLAILAGDQNAPHFYPDQEPVQDGRAYQAVDGRYYYRPVLNVSRRDGTPPSPEVRFLKDAQGVVRLQFELEETPPGGLPAGAEPFAVKVDQLVLQWVDAQGNAQQRIFDQPTRVSAGDPPDSAGPRFCLRVGAQLKADEVDGLYFALSKPASRAALNLTLSFGYWLDERPQGPSAPIDVIDIATDVATLDSPLLLNRALPVETVSAAVSQPEPLSGSIPVLQAELLAEAASPPFESLNLAALDLILQVPFDQVISEARQRERQSNYRSLSLNRLVPFIFDENLDSNRPIYGAITGGSMLTESWTDSAFGLVRKAAFPNTVYRLPDEIRLAYHPELGTPYMIPVLYRDAEGNLRVRVTLGAVPWHDPEQLVRLRDFLRVSSSGALAAPHIVVGGYKQANFKIKSAFPQEIQLVGGDEIAVSLENGFEVTLDLSQEFYQFLAQLLTRGVGLQGEVMVTVETKPAAEGQPPQVLTRPVQVRLTFNDLAGLPVGIRVDKDTLSPRQVQLVNEAQAEMRIGGCIPRLLQYDANSVAPLEIFEAEAIAAAFPAVLAPQAVLSVEMKPNQEHEGKFWNAVQVELIAPELNQPAESVLNHIHEVSPNGTLASELTVECPVFAASPVPDKWKNLHSLRVKVCRAGKSPILLTLDTKQARKAVTIQRTLNEIIGEDAKTIPTYQLQVQNIYFDHEGVWGAEKLSPGYEHFVYPNLPENV